MGVWEDERHDHAWSDKALAYRNSFATLCAGAIPDLLDRVGGQLGTLLLDVGCGDGSLAAEALRRGMAVTACDPDPGMRALAREATAGEAPIAPARRQRGDHLVLSAPTALHREPHQDRETPPRGAALVHRRTDPPGAAPGGPAATRPHGGRRRGVRGGGTNPSARQWGDERVGRRRPDAPRHTTHSHMRPS